MFEEVFRQQHLLIYSANRALKRHSFYFGSTINPFHVTHKISRSERMVSKDYTIFWEISERNICLFSPVKAVCVFPVI